MMITPATPRKPVSQSWLNQQFDENGWLERLASYTKDEDHHSLTPECRGLPKGTLTIGYNYYTAEKKAVATIFHYQHKDGKIIPWHGRDFRPKALLVDGVWCYVVSY
jgi:hypothetical protein